MQACRPFFAVLVCWCVTKSAAHRACAVIRTSTGRVCDVHGGVGWCQGCSAAAKPMYVGLRASKLRASYITEARVCNHCAKAAACASKQRSSNCGQPTLAVLAKELS